MRAATNPQPAFMVQPHIQVPESTLIRLAAPRATRVVVVQASHAADRVGVGHPDRHALLSTELHGVVRERPIPIGIEHQLDTHTQERQHGDLRIECQRLKQHRDRGLLASELMAALDRGLDDAYLIDQARALMRSRPSADTIARTERVLRQLRQA
jgi:hypothetical protein